MPELPRFHLAVAVDDLAAAGHFYGDLLGCERGRSAESWVDWNFAGHQLVTHLVAGNAGVAASLVDGDVVPVPHFGLVLDPATFAELARRLREHGVQFVLEPHVRFAGEPGEQSTMFLRDPAGNAIEFKAFADDRAVFDAE